MTKQTTIQDHRYAASYLRQQAAQKQTLATRMAGRFYRQTPEQKAVVAKIKKQARELLAAADALEEK